MQVFVKRAGCLLGLIAATIVPVALGSTSASAEVASPADVQFCAGNQVNNVQRCFGAPRQLNTVLAAGSTTGVCVGADTKEGPCGATGQFVTVHIETGVHSPWVQGTTSTLTYATAYAEIQ